MTTPLRIEPPPPDDPWDRAHVIPDFDGGPGWAAWLALALIVAALLAVGFLAWLTAEAAGRQAAVCMEGCA
ncbi:MAG: hypothetical protein HZT43_08230 [Exiguobacterium profundum]|nr:MAG: hypothetical protein HZT43_08230 [Exiguobacterium profundum]